MFYKFVGGDTKGLLKVFDLMVNKGSLMFSKPGTFNDPFEFKFNSVAPSSRTAVDAWHRQYDPDRTEAERQNAWTSFEGPATTWNTVLQPRLKLLQRLYVLCVARRYNSLLMWSHYTSQHTGFCVELDPKVIQAVAAKPGFQGFEPVVYSAAAPTLRWFDDPPDQAIRKAVLYKSRAWAYEAESRVIMISDRGESALFETVDPALMRGVILGARAPLEVRDAALELKAARPGFRVRQVVSGPQSYRIRLLDVDAKSHLWTHML